MDRSCRHLNDINKELFKQEDLFLTALDCFSVFAENKGILIIFSHNELLNIKLSVTNDNSPDKAPLKLEDNAKIKDVNGVTIVRDNLNSFLLTKDRKIYAFKSYKRIYEIEGFTNVKLFECFRDSCYVLVQQAGIEVKIQLFTSFGESSALRCEFDISYSKDSVTIDGCRDAEETCIHMVEGPLRVSDRNFFTELLACDLKQEKIYDVLLISINEKLMWIKYKNSFHEGAKDGYSIEAIKSSKENIRALKYCEGFLMMLDHLSILTIIYLCPRLKFITKKEILLEGQVKCFRFHQNLFIYSNLRQVIFIDTTNPSDPETHSVYLKGIVCFTIVKELNCIIAICRNQMFFHISLTRPKQQQQRKNDDFQALQNSDIELIPSIAKFVEVEEKKLAETEQKIKEAIHLKTLLQYLTTNRDFKAGDAVITFHQNFPEILPNTIICNVSNQQLGTGFIEIQINFSKILKSMTISVAFYRHSMSSVLTQIVKVVDAEENIQILLPAESTDDASNKMLLDLNFNYDYKEETRLLVYPISISRVVTYEGPRIKLKNNLDNCLEMVNKMKT